jgi:hypothetical protein
METLRIRRVRLRHELQDAYDIWMTASERQRHAYLAAKQQLVLAWAKD